MRIGAALNMHVELHNKIVTGKSRLIQIGNRVVERFVLELTMQSFKNGNESWGWRACSSLKTSRNWTPQIGDRAAWQRPSFLCAEECLEGVIGGCRSPAFKAMLFSSSGLADVLMVLLPTGES